MSGHAGLRQASRSLRVVVINVLVFNPEIQSIGTEDELIAPDAFGEIAGPRPGASGLSNGVVCSSGGESSASGSSWVHPHANWWCCSLVK